MTKYRFYEDRKVSVWERIYFSIEAATIETAEAQAAAIAHRSLYAAACDDAAIEIEESERTTKRSERSLRPRTRVVLRSESTV